MHSFVPYILIITLLYFGVEVDAIVGGETVTNETEIPFQVSVQYHNQHNCGGIILTHDVVLTAGHCLIGKDPEYISILAGTIDLFGGKHRSIHNVTGDMRIFPRTKPAADDIGLVKVTPIFQLDNFRQKALLSNKSEAIPKDLKVLISGWGQLGASSPGASRSLMKAHVYTQSHCKKRHDGSFCTLYTKYPIIPYFGQKKGICRGDSGGPVVLHKNGTNVVIGLVGGSGEEEENDKTKFHCASKKHSDRHTRLAYYMAWIESNVINILRSSDTLNIEVEKKENEKNKQENDNV